MKKFMFIGLAFLGLTACQNAANKTTEQKKEAKIMPLF